MTGRLFGVIPIYGLLICCAIGLGIFLCERDEKYYHFPKDTTIDMALWAVPPAIIGARLYYVAFTWEMFRDDPISILYLWQGGLAIYGAVIGGAIGCAICAKRKKISLAALVDMVVPMLLLGQAIGRWGNFFNGEAFGNIITDAKWQFFPAAVYVDGLWHQATFFYESAWNLAGFFLLYLNRKKAQKHGDVLLWYLLWYGAGRLSIEGLRTDSLMIGAMRVSQVLSAVMCFVALGIFLYRNKEKRVFLLLPLVSCALLVWYALNGGFWYTFAASVLFVLSGFCVYNKKKAPESESPA